MRGLDHGIATVVAGAGYGKTTLLAQVYAEDDRSWAWVSCDQRIPDGRSLLAHVAAAASEHVPGIEERLDAGTGDPFSLLADLTNELHETLTEELVITLDDVQTLPPDAVEIIEPLAKALPPSVCLLLASRERLPIGAASLRSSRGVALDESKLQMTGEEAAHLLASLSSSLGAEDYRRIHAVTEGWAAGVVLAAQSGGELAGAGALSRDQFDYLADEVLARQEQRLRRFLLGTAALSRFSPELAAAVTGLSDCGALAEELVTRRLFTVRLDTAGRWYRYHHLFLAFLRDRAEAETEGALAEQHRAAGAWWRERGDAVEAVRHFLEADAYEDAVTALEPVAEEMASSASAETLAGWLDDIPRALWEGRPPLMLAHASALTAAGRHEEAFAESERAVGALLRSGLDAGAAGALVRLQQAMLAAGTRPSRRIEAAERFIDRIEPDAPLLPVARGLLASAYGYACRFEEAARQLDAVESGGPDEGIASMATVARGFYVDFWIGAPTRALDRIRDARRSLEALRDDPFAFLPTALMLEIYLCNELGFFDEAKRSTENWEDLWTAAGLGRRTAGRSEGWVRGSWLAGTGAWDELEAAVPPPPVPDRRNASSYAYRNRVLAARLAAARRDRAAVAAHIDGARAAMELFEPVFDDATFLCDLAYAAADVGLSTLASDLSRAARTRAGEVASPWLRGRSSLVCAVVDVRSDERLAWLERALEETERWGLSPLWTHRERRLAPALLALALEQDLGPPGTARRLLVASRAEGVAAALAAAESRATRRKLVELVPEIPDLSLTTLDSLMRDPDNRVRKIARGSAELLTGRARAPIALRTLGGLEVLRDGLPVPAAAFESASSRELLARILAADASGKTASPPPDPGVVDELHRALQPELGRDDPGALIVDDHGLRLRLAPGDSWDVADLQAIAEAHLASGEERREHLLEHERMLRDSFLPEWASAEWAEEPRNSLEAIQTALTGELGELLLADGEAGAAVTRFRRVVERAPDDERWHRGLLSALAGSGNRASALGHYQALRSRILREAGREPSPETRDLYAQILLKEQAASGRREDGTVTIVFTDMEDSTRVAKHLGDHAWARVVRSHDRAATHAAAVHGGRVIKSQGDGVMAAFPSARGGLGFAIAFQQRMSEDPGPTGGENLSIRVGVHTGEAVREGDDYLGHTVIVASRIADAARGGEILATSTVLDLLAGDQLANRFGDRRDLRLRGIGGSLGVHAVGWRDMVRVEEP